MNGFADFITYVLVAVFAENCLLSGAADTKAAVASLRRLPRLAVVSALICAAALFDAFALYLFGRTGLKAVDYMPVRGLVAALAAVLWYFIADAVFRRTGRVERSMTVCAAFNGAVLAFPLLPDAVGSIAGVFAAGVGAGLGFALAAWLIGVGLRHFDNPDMSKNMRGAPSMLIYIGLFALAFSAFGR